MPLQASSLHLHGAKALPGRKPKRKMEWMRGCEKIDENGSILSLTRLCLLSLADNMKLWAKDYSDKYLKQYSCRDFIGPFNLLAGELVEELTWLLGTRKQLSRATLPLLLVPQLKGLSLGLCPGLATSALCGYIAARCQDLCSLDLSGAQHLPSKVLSETLHHLPALRSLSLAGTPCDRYVIRTIVQYCPSLCHLDVSHCHFLSPAALLLLRGGPSCSLSSSSSSSCCTSTSNTSISPPCLDPSSFSTPLPPLPLRSLLALDIGFGEQKGDPVAAAAYLLLSLPWLERVDMEGVLQACCLIVYRKFGKMDEFADREGVPRLDEVWRERRHRQGMMESCRDQRKGAVGDEDEEEEEESTSEQGCRSESEEGASRAEIPSGPQKQAVEKRRKKVLSQLGEERLTLRLREVPCLTWDSLDSVSRLCPDICSISLIVDEDEGTGGRSRRSLLALSTWSGRLQSLSVRYPGPMADIVPALQVVGSSLVSLTLEGVQTNALLEVIQACPRLRDLLISGKPPMTPQREEEEEGDDGDLPRLPNLRTLRLNLSYAHTQMISWTRMLKCLLIGSPLLEKLSLVSWPFPLNFVLQDVLHIGHLVPNRFADNNHVPPMPLARIQRLELPWTDVTITTVTMIMQRSKRLKYVDVKHCRHISHLNLFYRKMFNDL